MRQMVNPVMLRFNPCRVFSLRAILLTLILLLPLNALAMQVEKVMDEDSYPRAFTLDLYGSDADGDKPQWSVSKQGAHGEASIDTSGDVIKVHFKPEKDWNGQDQFFVRLSDGVGGHSQLKVIVQVMPANDPPVNQVLPIIIGDAQIGETLSADQGAWDDSTDGEAGFFTYSYQWMRAMSADQSALLPIVGATDETYTLTGDDDGAFLAVRVTAHDRGNGGQTLMSAALSGFNRVGNHAPMISLTAPVPEPIIPAEPEVPAEEMFVLNGFDYEGNKTHSADELNQALADYIGQPIGLSGLNEAANKITKFYRDNSHVIASAQILEQELGEDGRVVMTIMEGTLGQVTVSGNQNFADEFIREYITSALDGSLLKSDELEAGLMALNRNPGLTARSVLARGENPGEVDVNIQAEDSKPFGVSFQYNNYGSDTISQNRYVIGLDLYDLADMGGHIATQIMVGDNTDDLAFGSFSFDMPVDSKGTRIGFNVSSGTYDVPNTFADLGIKGDSTTGSLFVNHPFILSRELSVIGEAGFEAKDANFYLLGTQTDADRVRSLYASVDSSFNLGGGKAVVAGRLTQGLGDVLGGSADDTNTSRNGADNLFTKIQVSAAYNRPLDDNWALFGSATGQWTDDSVMSSEEFSIGGVGSVRGYSPSAETGNSGYRSSIELRYHYKGDFPWIAYGFVDHGYVSRKDPLIAQDKSASLTGAGIGFASEYKYEDVTTNLTLDIGWPLSPDVNTLDDSPVVNVKASVNY